MKQIFLTVVFLTTAILGLNAQTLREMTVEPTTADGTPLFIDICRSPGLGVLVFRSAIEGLEFRLNMPEGLVNTNHNRNNNEYVLCVHPTERWYWITITGPGFEPVNFQVRDVIAATPQFFRINPIESAVISAIAESNFSRGTESMNNSEFAQAERYFRLAVNEAPDNVEFLINLSRAYSQQGKHAQATTVLQRATNIRPNNAEIHNMLGNAFFAQGDYQSAIESYSNAVDLAPNNTLYRSDLQRAMNANPANTARAHADRGNRFLIEGNFSEALRSFQDAAAADPQNREYQTAARLAQTRVRQQRYMDNAAAAYRAAQSQERGSSAHRSRLRDAVTYTERAERLGRAELEGLRRRDDGLTPEWRNTANFYTREHQRYVRRNRWGYVLAVVGVGGLVALEATGVTNILDEISNEN